MTQRSSHDGQPLPLSWQYRTAAEKRAAITSIVKLGWDEPSWWSAMPPASKDRVIEHLKASGQINDGKSALQKRFGFDQPNWLTSRDFRGRIPEVTIEPLYDKPNGGPRILPSLYGRIRGAWVRMTGRTVLPSEMNDGHLENTIALLKESHGNVSARAQDLLGRISYHYQNQPFIVDTLEMLCLQMQMVDVDEMYPIFVDLSEELASRELDISRVEFSPQPIDDDLLKGW